MKLRSAVRFSPLVAFLAAVSVIPSSAPAQVLRDEVAPVQEPQLFDADFTSDGEFFVTGGDAIRIYATEDGLLAQHIPAPRQARAVACSPTQKDVYATGGGDGVVRLWNMSQDKPQRVLNSHTRFVTDLAFSPNGRLLASVGFHRDQQDREIFNGEFRLWDTETGQLVRDFDLLGQWIAGVCFSSDGKRLAFSTRAKNGQSSVQIYNVRNWKLERSIPFGSGAVFSLTFANRADQLVIAGSGVRGAIWLANVDSGEPPKQIATEPSGEFRTSSAAPEGDHFATGTTIMRVTADSKGRVMGRYLVAQIQMRKVDSGEVMWVQEGELGDPYGITVSPDGKLVGCCTGTKVLLLNAESGARIRTIDVEK